MSWQHWAARLAGELEETVERVRHRVLPRTPGDRPARIVGYRGYGTPDCMHVMGRILHGPPPTRASPHDRWWSNLANAYRRLESDEASGAVVRVEFEGTAVEATADREGHLRVELRPEEEPEPGRYWHRIAVELLEPEGPGATVPVAIPSSPRFGVISDLDDTVVQTDVRNLLRMAREVLFGNAHTRIAFPGVGAFYRALHEGTNPIFYVSSSPWNLYDVLSEFLELHRIPAGPMILRNWGLAAGNGLPRGHHGHKRAAIDRILGTYPELPFLLVGDSGQEDPEIYRSVVHDHPDRVMGIYIRSVVPDPTRIASVRALTDELGEHDIPLVLADDTLSAARHAADRGWVDPAAIAAVAADRELEREQTEPD